MVGNQENLEKARKPEPFPREEKIPTYRNIVGKMFKRKVRSPSKREELKKAKPQGALDAVLFGPRRVSKTPEKDDSIFRGKPYVKRLELREKFRKASPYIPGTGGKMFRKEERLTLLKKLLPREKYGEFITPQKIKDAMKKFEKSTWGKPHKERFQAEREIRYLKKHLGPEIKK